MKLNKIAAILSTTVLVGPSVMPQNIIANSNHQKIIFTNSTSTNNKDFTLSSSNVNRLENKYSISSCKDKGIIKKSLDLFGDMRNLTEEEEESYVQGLAQISTPTGYKLF